MSDDQTARLALPYLAAGQMQKHVTLNEALTRLDALVQTAVVSATTTAPPPAPDDGDLYILPVGVTGLAWAGQGAGTLMRAEAGGWSVVAAPDGLVVLIQDSGELWVRDGGAWVGAGARLGTVQNLDRLGVGTTADALNPFVARLNKALWTALEAGSGGDGDLRLTLNKETAGDVLSLLFQTGFSGRAEIGLLGDDDLRLKVSGDGTSWSEAVSVDRASGRMTFPLGAGRCAVTAFSVNGGYTIPAWATRIEAVILGGGGGGGAGAFAASGSRFGGGGGGAGGISRATWSADLLRTGGVTVNVGQGGAGGTTTAGAGGSGSVVYLAGTPVLTATGGGGGGLGGAASGAAGSAGAGAPPSNGGGASSVTATGAPGKSFDRPDAPGGGGAGGGLDGSGTARAGGAGGDGGALAVKALGGVGGAAAAGSAGTAAPQPTLHWAGGGGGGGGGVTSGSGHPGAGGGLSSGGGGGGGAGVSAGGAGGAGAAGLVWLVAVG